MSIDFCRDFYEPIYICARDAVRFVWSRNLILERRLVTLTFKSWN